MVLRWRRAARPACAALLAALLTAGCAGGHPPSVSSAAAAAKGATSAASAPTAGAAPAAASGAAAPAAVVATRTPQLRPLASGPPALFSAVWFLNVEDGWVGGKGEVGATTDGGQVWTWHALPGGITPASLGFANARSGWLAGGTAACALGPRDAAGCESVLMHTADGGATWARQAAVACGKGCAAGEVEAVGAAHAWALVACAQGGTVGQPCQDLLSTADGGARWHRVALPPGFAPTDIAFVSAAQGWVAGYRCAAHAAGPSQCPTAVLHTVDGGGAWQSETLPAGLTGGSDLSFAGARDGWLVPAPSTCAMDGCFVPLYATTDGGRTWRKVPSTYGHTGFQGKPAFVNASDGFLPLAAGAASGRGGVAGTSDGGRTWTSAGGARDWSVAALSAVGPEDVWAIGTQKLAPVTSDAGPGFLVHSADGGRTWTQVLPAPRPITAVDFVDAADGFGIGTAADPGAVVVTRDGGARWTEVAGEAQTGAWLRYVSFVNTRDGWAAGTTALAAPGAAARPVILATTDGGRTWTAVDHPPGTVVGLGFSDAAHGWMGSTPDPGGGYAVTLWTTADGGRSWSAGGDAAAGDQLMSLGFSDPGHGWAVGFVRGNGGPHYTLSATDSGGAAWSRVARFPFGEGGPIAAYPTGPETGWVVQGASLLHTGDGGRTWTRFAPAVPGVTDLDFTGGAQGWLLTTKSLWHTMDGGEVWTQLG